MAVYVNEVMIGSSKAEELGTSCKVERSVHEGWFLLSTQTGKPIEFHPNELSEAIALLKRDRA